MVCYIQSLLLYCDITTYILIISQSIVIDYNSNDDDDDLRLATDKLSLYFYRTITNKNSQTLTMITEIYTMIHDITRLQAWTRFVRLVCTICTNASIAWSKYGWKEEAVYLDFVHITSSGQRKLKTDAQNAITSQNPNKNQMKVIIT